MTILVVAEHDNIVLDPSTHYTVGAAALIATFTGLEVHVLVAGSDALRAAEAATSIAGVSKAILVDLQDPVATVAKVAQGYSHVLVPGTIRGRRLALDLAERLGVAPTNAVSAVVNAVTVEHAVAGRHGSAAMLSNRGVNLMTVSLADFDAAAAQGGAAVLHKMEVREQVRCRSTALGEKQGLRLGSGGFGARCTGMFDHSMIYKSLSEKLEIAICESRVFRERLNLSRHSCLS